MSVGQCASEERNDTIAYTYKCYMYVGRLKYKQLRLSNVTHSLLISAYSTHARSWYSLLAMFRDSLAVHLTEPAEHRRLKRHLATDLITRFQE
jgi:hypothetical protein